MFKNRCEYSKHVSNGVANVLNTFIIFKTRFKCYTPPCIPNALLIPEQKISGKYQSPYSVAILFNNECKKKRMTPRFWYSTIQKINCHFFYVGDGLELFPTDAPLHTRSLSVKRQCEVTKPQQNLAGWFAVPNPQMIKR